MKTPIAFAVGAAFATAAVYYVAIRPLTLAAELSAQAGFMLVQARAKELDRRNQ